MSLLIPTEFLLKQTFNELALGQTIYQCVYYFPERKRYTLETSLANPEITLPVQNKALEYTLTLSSLVWSQVPINKKVLYTWMTKPFYWPQKSNNSCYFLLPNILPLLLSLSTKKRRVFSNIYKSFFHCEVKEKEGRKKSTSQIWNKKQELFDNFKSYFMMKEKYLAILWSIVDRS